MSEYAVTFNVARELVQLPISIRSSKCDDELELRKLKVPVLLPCKVRDMNVPELTYSAVICVAKKYISIEVTSRDSDGLFQDALWESKFYELSRFIITPANIPHEFLSTRIPKLRIDYISHSNRTFTFVLNSLFEQKPISVTFASEQIDKEFYDQLDKSYIRLEKSMFNGSYLTEEDYQLFVENGDILLNKHNVYFLVNTRSNKDGRKLLNWSSCQVEGQIASSLVKTNIDSMRWRLDQNFLNSEGTPTEVYHKYRKMIKVLKHSFEYQRKKEMSLARFFEKTDNPALKSK